MIKLALVVLLVVGALLAIRVVRYRRVQALRPPPPVGGVGDGAPAVRGRYLGTQVQGRASRGAFGRRGRAVLRLSRAGVLVESSADPPLWIPAADLAGARADAAGIVRVGWRLGRRRCDTAFRLDEEDGAPAWAAAVAGLMAAGEQAG